MTAYLLTNHLLNFVAPALFLAVVLVVLMRFFARFFSSKKPWVQGFWAQIVIAFAVNLLVLVAGFAVFGHDAKMATYAALVLAAAACQWVMRLSWQA